MLNLQGQDLTAKKQNMRAAIEGLADAVLNGNDELFADFLRLDRLLWRYSFTNTALILFQKPDSRRVSAIRRFDRLARERGHAAKKGPRDKYPSAVAPKAGTRAAWVWVPKQFKREVDNGDGTTGTESGVYFSPGPVWGVEDLYFKDTGKDCSADPDFLPDFLPDHGDRAGDYHDALKVWAQGEGITVEEGNTGDAAGLSYGGRIVERIGDPVGKRFAVLVHEVGHELLHKVEDRSELSRKVKETEAEAVAMVVCEYFGFAQAEHSAAYLRNHGANRQDVLDSMDRIHKTATIIIDAIEAEAVEAVEANG